MSLQSERLAAPRAVTFDCWGTLIFEPDGRAAHLRRLEMLSRTAEGAGLGADAETIRAALHTAWARHLDLWQECVASGSREMAGWALAELGLDDEEAAERLGSAFAEASLTSEIATLEGARASLHRLADAGVRRALVCDTGFSPGRVVRELLDREGLLELLEVCIFSDEAGVPKPHPSVFHSALEPLGADPHQAVHVGDLRRTDVAGARAAGMVTVRISWHHDDRSDLPEADAVVESHRHLLEVLGL
jgi:putative hydrolase of the HAD superfamily